MTKIRRALISVSDTAHLGEFAQFLSAADIDIVATGRTHRFLREHQIPARAVEDFTGMPEIMAGRVKTLHPKVHGGLLSRRDQDEAEVRAHGIEEIDLLVVNLYPFEATIARPDCTLDTAIENIDVGGPAMLRAAAKNHAYVTTVCDPADYDLVRDEIRANGGVSAPTRRRLAVKVFQHTADYDATVARFLEVPETTPKEMTATCDEGVLPRHKWLGLTRQSVLAYGENPHQKAAFYIETGAAGEPADMTLLQGKPLSYNNIADATAAYLCVNEFEQPACVIVKHQTPCGVACGDNLVAAYQLALDADALSAFGGVIAFNRPADEAVANAVIASQFAEAVIAPEVEDRARERFADKAKMRILRSPARTEERLQFRSAHGGYLAQEIDAGQLSRTACRVVTPRTPSEDEWRDLLFAWHVVGHVKSNAIVMANQMQTVGIGGGQPNRVGAVEMAAHTKHAKMGTTPVVMASDAFFPFRDGLDEARKAGVTAIIQPGGSVRDEEVIAVATEHDMAMVFTGIRRFRH